MNTAPGHAAGGIDTKVSSLKLMADGTKTEVRGGMTFGGESKLEPFCWVPRFDETPHVGHPECFDYDFSVIQPKLF